MLFDRNRNLSLRMTVSATLFALCLGGVHSAAFAQGNPPPAQPGAPAPLIPQGNTGPTVDLATANIESGDFVQVNVLGQPDVSGQFLVGKDGMITAPLVGQVKVLDMPAVKAAAVYRQQLIKKKLIKDPQVTMFIAARPAMTVQVSGAITSQGKITIQKDTRLSDVLVPAGITQNADLTKVVITRGDTDTTYDFFSFYSGKDRGDKFNPTLQKDDKIFVYAKTGAIAAGFVKVFGGVTTPNNFPVTPDLTVGQILQQAGGLTPYGDRKGIYIDRAGSRIPVDYEAIERRVAGADVPLQDKDVVNVPILERPKTIDVNGAVVRGGPQAILAPLNLQQALAAAGGPIDGARTKEIEVRRSQADGKIVSTKYDYSKTSDMTTMLEPGDVVMVPYPKNRPPFNALTALGLLGSFGWLLRR